LKTGKVLRGYHKMGCAITGQRPARVGIQTRFRANSGKNPLDWEGCTNGGGAKKTSPPKKGKKKKKNNWGLESDQTLKKEGHKKKWQRDPEVLQPGRRRVSGKKMDDPPSSDFPWIKNRRLGKSHVGYPLLVPWHREGLRSHREKKEKWDAGDVFRGVVGSQTLGEKMGKKSCRIRGVQTAKGRHDHQRPSRVKNPEKTHNGSRWRQKDSAVTGGQQAPTGATGA